MNKRIAYTKGPVGAVRIVEDFLPPPGELVVKEEVEKVTISQSTRSSTRRPTNHWRAAVNDKAL